MKLLERRAAIEALISALQSVRSGEGRLVLVSGEAGIGKTSVVQSFLQDHRGGVVRAVGQCEALHAPQPLGPFRDLAAQIGGGIASVFERRDAPQQLLQPLLAELGRRPAVLVVEDAHWADEASLDLIQSLARRLSGLPVLFIVTHRDDELEDGHPLRRLLGALATSPWVSRIELQRLTVEAVEELVLPVGLDAMEVWRRTGGNPFFVAALIESRDGRQVPASIRVLADGRLARLSPAALDLARAVAVIGKAEARLLLALSDDAGDSAQECVARGLLRDEGAFLTFRHDLLRQAVLATISSPLLQALHSKVLAALLRLGTADPARIAHHAHGARDGAAVLLYAPLAAKAAASAGSHREAALLFELALQYAEEPTHRRAALLMGHARECAALDQLDRSAGSFDESAAISRALGDDRGAAAALAAVALPLVRSGKNREADRCAREAIRLLEPGGESRDLAFALRIQAHLRMLDRDKAQALHFGRRAIGMAERLADLETVAAASMTVGAALLVADQSEGRPYLDRAMAVSAEAGFDELQAQTYLMLGSAYGEQYHFTEAERFLTEGIAFASARDLVQHLHYMQAWIALVHLYRGRLRSAVRAADEVLCGTEVATVSRIMALVASGRAKARMGDQGWREALDTALTLAVPTATLQRLAPTRLARAEAAWLDGCPDRAAEEASAIWSLALSHRHQWHTAEAAYWGGFSGHAREVPAWAARPFALQLQGRWREAAEAWRTLGCPYEEARALACGDAPAQLAALRIFDKLGAVPAAAALRRSMKRKGLRHLPRGPRRPARSSELGLTPRQARVLAMVADGLTNVAISGQLQISVRTVDHHVAAILAKLEVSSREEAASRLKILQDRQPSRST